MSGAEVGLAAGLGLACPRQGGRIKGGFVRREKAVSHATERGGGRTPSFRGARRCAPALDSAQPGGRSSAVRAPAAPALPAASTPAPSEPPAASGGRPGWLHLRGPCRVPALHRKACRSRAFSGLFFQQVSTQNAPPSCAHCGLVLFCNALDVSRESVISDQLLMG